MSSCSRWGTRLTSVVKSKPLLCMGPVPEPCLPLASLSALTCTKGRANRRCGLRRIAEAWLGGASHLEICQLVASLPSQHLRQHTGKA